MNLKKIFDSNFDSRLKKVLSEEDYEGYTIKICELKSDRADEGRIGYAIYEGDDFLTWGSGYNNTKNALEFAKEDVDTNLLGKVEDYRNIRDSVRRPAKPKMTRTQSKKSNEDVTEKMKAAIQECYKRTLPLFDYEFIFCDESTIEFSEDELSVEIPFCIPNLETSGSIMYSIYNEIPLKTGEDSDIEVKASYFNEYGQNLFNYLSATQSAPMGYQKDFSIEGAITKVKEALESDKKYAMDQEG